MVVIPIPFDIIMPLANLWLICLQEHFPILRAKRFPDLYLLIFPPKRSLVLGRGRILIPGFTWSVYDIVTLSS
jgi:hypothetical protein